MTRMLKFGQPMGGIVQEAFIVPDIEAGVDHFVKHLKIGPFFVIEHFSIHDFHYRGRPGKLDVTIALGFSGSMCYELIQQNDKTPSVYTETYEKRGWGFHHWAIATDRFDEHVKAYEKQGASMALYGVTDFGTRAAYMDTSSTLPGMIELIEMGAAAEDFFAVIQAASVGWDGKNPVRSFG
jgi:hypothetical protein